MNLKEYIDDADLVLVGIGETFQDKFETIKVQDEKNITIFFITFYPKGKNIHRTYEPKG